MIKKKNIKIYSDKNFCVDKIKLKSLIADVIKLLSVELKNIEVNFISDSRMIEMNNKYLSHNYSTDIITFDYSDDTKIDTELFINYDAALFNSKRYFVSYNSEIIRLVVHGILHVTGFDDKSKSKKIIMKRTENSIVEKFKNYLILKNEC